MELAFFYDNVDLVYLFKYNLNNKPNRFREFV